MSPQDARLSAEIIGLLVARGQTLAVAESLTGGLLAAALTEIPGSSAAFRGGVVSYATDLKAALLGVPSDLLDQHGAVHPAVAAAMAQGACRRLTASVGAATTGVAGPIRPTASRWARSLSRSAWARTLPLTCGRWPFPGTGSRSGPPR